jgi:DNA adenine methylase
MVTREYKSLKSSESGGKPFLRWAGSKRKQIAVLSSFWNMEFHRYVEPFMGSACLFFALQPPKALLADINSDLVRTFTAVQNHPRAVWNRLVKIPLGKRSYYRLRKSRTPADCPCDAAARFIFLNRFCFNGLYRTNTQGEFNVPYGSAGTGRVPTVGELVRAGTALHSAEIKCADFEETLAETKAGDFVYLDPPYAVENRRVFRQYGPQTFGLNDMSRLASELEALNRKGVAFILSYAFCREGLEHFSRWPRRKLFVQRNIAGFADCRRTAAELLISNLFNQ